MKVHEPRAQLTTRFDRVEQLSGVVPAVAQDTADEGGQDAETKALDSTATQWSFQFAYQWMTWKDDILDNGETRRAGLDNYVQLRIVAPVPLKGFTILPRLTLRHYENVNSGESGFGNTEIFALMIPSSWDWGSGRFGIHRSRCGLSRLLSVDPAFIISERNGGEAWATKSSGGVGV